ncbi:hypothetical protein PILCRDRAFT_812454 [Piloderma croceum F 1598]|uniref:Ubiquitin 3 binding protein But2 C-terminal domain-containing protein n=1 Tax=Piloderma croceum (strain F 1598) TaxID=765440 RepID=A0A0C3CIW6_PILCF|nr:hypothetical protein PILCRDRAFT_812454 [Piloderma croceum F 1598]
MASYLRLQAHDPDYSDSEDTIKHPLLPDEGSNPESHATPTLKWANWPIIGLSVIVVVCACILYISSANIPGPRDARGLRKPNQYPGLELVEMLGKKRKGPSVYFPAAIIRANKAVPDQVYTSNSHVVLSDNDSMFYQWHMPSSQFTSCYIDGFVPTPEEGRRVNKTYTSSGSLTTIQVWNVTTLTKRMENFSWNTRPQRIALMGTVAFLPEKERSDQLNYEDGWQLRAPTPRFACGEKATYTIEVACKGCKLEFEQIFSSPALAFDLVQIG